MDYYYCLISLSLQRYIVLYLFKKKNDYPVCLIACNARNISKLILIHNSFINLSSSHLLYLGQELYKAELALKFSQEYIQN